MVKKIISIVLSLVLILGACLVGNERAFAAESVILNQGRKITELKMSIGDKAEINAILSGSMGGIFWKSSDENVVTLSYRGDTATLVARGGGSCTVTAMSMNNVSVSISVTVGSFNVAPYLDMGVGMKMPIYNGAAEGKVKFKIKKKYKGICSVSKKGMVKAKKLGTAIVKVKTGGRSYNCEVRVNDVRYDESHKIQMIAVGATFKAPILYADALSATVTANNPEIVSFNGTTGTGLKQGSTDYTITCNGKSYTGRIFVIEDVECPFVMQTDNVIHIKSGETLKIPVFGAYDGGLEWSTSNREVAVVAYKADDRKIIPYGVGMNSWYADFSIMGVSAGDCDLKISVKGVTYKSVKIIVE